MVLHKLTLLPRGIDILLPSGAPLTDIEYESSERIIPFGCRSGACGACVDALGEVGAEELDFLEDLHLGDGKHRLACQCRLLGPATVRVD